MSPIFSIGAGFIPRYSHMLTWIIKTLLNVSSYSQESLRKTPISTPFRSGILSSSFRSFPLIRFTIGAVSKGHSSVGMLVTIPFIYLLARSLFSPLPIPLFLHVPTYPLLPLFPQRPKVLCSSCATILASHWGVIQFPPSLHVIQFHSASSARPQDSLSTPSNTSRQRFSHRLSCDSQRLLEILSRILCDSLIDSLTDPLTVSLCLSCVSQWSGLPFPLAFLMLGAGFLAITSLFPSALSFAQNLAHLTPYTSSTYLRSFVITLRYSLRLISDSFFPLIHSRSQLNTIGVFLRSLVHFCSVHLAVAWLPRSSKVHKILSVLLRSLMLLLWFSLQSGKKWARA